MLRNSQVLHESSNLAFWLRLYIYGLHGFFIEVLFTAGWEFVVSSNWKLPGYTSVWSLAIYGISGVVMEQIYEACKRTQLPLLVRGVCYLLWVYAWEFSTGFLLRQFNACPWDYSEFTYNVRGLITFEYAPLWFFVSILMERVVIAHLSELRWSTSATSLQAEKSHNGLSARMIRNNANNAQYVVHNTEIGNVCFSRYRSKYDNTVAHVQYFVTRSCWTFVDPILSDLHPVHSHVAFQ